MAESEGKPCRPKKEEEEEEEEKNREEPRFQDRAPQRSPGTARIKEEPEEHSVKREEEQLPVSVPESSAVSVKREESSLLLLLQQRRTEQREETQGEDISSDPDFHSAPETSSTANNGDMTGTATGDEGREHSCSVCPKRFKTKKTLQKHMKLHTGEKPFSCKSCKKSFALKEYLIAHERLHTEERRFRCRICKSAFLAEAHLRQHLKSHQKGLFRCAVCPAQYVDMTQVRAHSYSVHKFHKQYGCFGCRQAFVSMSTVKEHRAMHLQEKRSGKRRQVLNPSVPSTSAGPALNRELTKSAQTEEEPKEQSVKQEEEQPPVSVPESSAVCVKREESSLLQQRQTEHREETQGEDISSEPHFHSTLSPNYKSAPVLRIVAVTGSVPSTSAGPSLKQELTETAQIKEEPEEQGVKREEEPPPVSVPESSAVCVKREDSSLLQQRQTEPREETQGEDISSEPHYHSAPETSSTANTGDMTGTATGDEKKHQCSVCQKRFKTKQSLQSHMRVHTGERPYSCTVCQKAFAQKHTLVYHIRTHTGEKPFICSICNKAFGINSSLKAHMKKHSGEKPFSSSPLPRSDPQRHRTTHGEEQPFTERLQTLYPRIIEVRGGVPSLSAGPAVNQELLPVSVPESSAVFVKRGESSLLQQRQTERREETRAENISSYPGFHSAPETSSTRQHTGERPFKCPFCEKAFTVKVYLNKHIKTHKRFRCAVCPAQYVDMTQVRAHSYKVHKFHKQYGCFECRQAFVSMRTVREHKAMHREEKRSGKRRQVLNPSVPSTSAGPALNRELTKTAQTEEEPKERSNKRDKKQPPVSVPESSAVFVKREDSSLLQQRQTEPREETQGEDISSEPHYHSAPETSSTANTGDMTGTATGDEKKHQCSVCQKRFKTKKQLRIHTRVHTGERPYSCTVCQKAFAQKHTLVYHIRTHTGEKPFICSICNKAFGINSSLKAHMKKHSGEKPFSSSPLPRSDPQRHRTTHGEEQPFTERLQTLYPRIIEVRGGVPSLSAGPAVNHWQELLPVFVPESSAVSVEAVRTLLSTQRQTEPREETQGEDISSEPDFHSETKGNTELSSDTDNDDDWEPFDCSSAQTETEAGVQSRARNTALFPKHKSDPETSSTANDGDVTGTEPGDEGKKHQCSVCQKRFKTKQSLQIHMRRHTGEKPYSCTDCEKTFAHKNALVNHIRTHSGEKLFICSICNKEFSQNSSLQVHLKKHSGEKPFRCSRCDKAFALRNMLTAHEKTHTGEKPYCCTICKKTFTRKDNLNKHLRTNKCEKPFRWKSPPRSDVQQHRTTHEEEQPFTERHQTLYPRIIEVRGGVPSLSAGPAVNQEQLPVSVPESSAVCVKRGESSLLSLLQQQRQTDPREGTQGRDISSESNFHSALSSNSKSAPEASSTASGGNMRGTATGAEGHTDNDDDWESCNSSPERRRFQCHVCQKSYTTKHSLQTHFRVHTGERPFRCQYCEKSFAVKQLLVNHEKQHTGDRPFICPICNSAFTLNTVLRKHLKAHDQPKPRIRCALCPKKFANPFLLSEHCNLSHNFVKQFPCTKCGQSFFQVRDRSLHKAQMHKETQNQTKTKNQRKVLFPRIAQVTGDVPSTSAGPALNQELTKIAPTEEEPEQRSEREEEQLPVRVPESRAVLSESSLLQQRQTQTISSERDFHSTLLPKHKSLPETSSCVYDGERGAEGHTEHPALEGSPVKPGTTYTRDKPCSSHLMLMSILSTFFKERERTMEQNEEEPCCSKYIDQVQRQPEEEQLLLWVPDFRALCVTPHESSLLQQRQTEPKEGTRVEDISPEPHFRSTLTPDYKSAPETSSTPTDGDLTGTERGTEVDLALRNTEVTGSVPSSIPGPSLKQELTDTAQIKEEPEEQGVKQEEEQLPVSVPESGAVCVKREESSLSQQTQTEPKEETQGEDISSEPHFHSETEAHTELSSYTDNDDDDDREPPFSCSMRRKTTEQDKKERCRSKDMDQVQREPEEEQLLLSVPESSAVCVKREESSLSQQTQTEAKEETQEEDISLEPHFRSTLSPKHESAPGTSSTANDGDMRPHTEKNKEKLRRSKDVNQLLNQPTNEALFVQRFSYRNGSASQIVINPTKPTLPPHVTQQVLYPRVVLSRIQIPLSPGRGPNQELTETAQIKEEPEEQSDKQEEESVPESSAVCVKREEGHTELSSDPDNDDDSDDDWEPPLRRSSAQTETDSDGDDYSNVHVKDRRTAARTSALFPKHKSAPETSSTANEGDVTGTEAGAEGLPEISSNTDNDDDWESCSSSPEGKKHQCSVCKKRFKTKRNLQIHNRLHTGERPYSCSYCNKTFTQRGNLYLHEQTHTGRKSHSCVICEEKFQRNSSLKEHMKTHTGERPFSCTVCQQTFTRKQNLDEHQKTHTGHKPFRCSHCKKTFARKRALNIHERTHTGYKPYSCAVCKKTFTQKTSLVLHQRTHNGEKPYSCTTCNKSYPQKSSLDLHLKTHTGEKPFRCPHCDQAFAHKGHLNVHVRTHTR